MTILIIEDSLTIRNIISKSLSAYGYIIESTTLKDYAKKKENFSNESLIITNTQITNHVKDFFGDIEHKTNRPFIIGLITKGTWIEKVTFLNNGGDDVISYPFPVKELIARIQAVLRRPISSKNSVIKKRALTIDTIERRVFIKENEISVSRKEFTLIEYFLRNTGRIISRTEIMDSVWDYRKIVNSNTVDVHIKNIRKKFSKYLNIETVHGIGYKLNDKPKRNYRRMKSLADIK